MKIDFLTLFMPHKATNYLKNESSLIKFYLQGEKRLIKLKDIYAGLPDAKDEYAYEDYETIKKCFVCPPNFDINEIITGKKCFIRGYKGTGKTALLYYISNKLLEEDACARISFLLFKNFDNTQKENIQNLAAHINKPKEFSLTVPNDYDISADGYIYIWKWILLEQILRDNEDCNNGLFESDDSYGLFEKTLKIISYDRVYKQPFKFPMSITFACGVNIPPYNVTIKPEMKLEFNKFQQNQKLFNIFKNVIDDSMLALSKCHRTDIPYYIMLDELEAFYQKEEIFKRDLYLLRDLIFTVKEFNLLFAKAKFTKIKFICCIRTEVVAAINKHIPTYEINKITSGFEFPLLWNYNNNNINHPIFQILLKRIQYTELTKNQLELSDQETYDKWFDKRIDDNPTFDVFLNQTWNKPRDVVRFLIAIQSSLSANAAKFNKQSFVDSMDEYSKRSLEELREELNASYSKEEIDEIFIWLNGFRTIFTLQELEERVNKFFPNSALKNSIGEVLKSLYRIGVVGNFSKITKSFLWKHRGNDDPVFDDEWLFFIHRGLFKALNINTKTNYKKFLFSQKRDVKVGETFEVTIEKILPRMLLVKFTDNFATHTGTVYAEDLQEIVSSDDIYFEYNVGDSFEAKIISYNEKHKSWRFKRIYDADTKIVS